MNKQFDILIVEDEQVIVDAAKKILIPKGLTIDEALNSEIALKKLQQNKYKLILSDLMLPHISGFELIKKVQRTNAEIAIIIITGYAMIENTIKCFKVGAFDLIPKPFDVDELLGVVSRAMTHTEMIRETMTVAKQFQTVNEKHPGSDKTGEYYFLGQHSWAKIDQDGVAVIGVGDTFPGRMGEIREVEFPAVNTEIWQGNLCVKIISQEHLIHTVWAPLSGRVVEINHEIEQNAKLINTDPFNLGWLVKIKPTHLEGELENLIPH